MKEKNTLNKNHFRNTAGHNPCKTHKARTTLCNYKNRTNFSSPRDNHSKNPPITSNCLFSVEDLTLSEAIDQVRAESGGRLSLESINAYRTIQRHHFQAIMHLPINTLTNELLGKAVVNETKPLHTTGFFRFKKSAPLSPTDYKLLAVVMQRYCPAINTDVFFPAKNSKTEKRTYTKYVQKIRKWVLTILCIFSTFHVCTEFQITLVNQSITIPADEKPVCIQQTINRN